jgi:hypothetical protein
MRPAEDRHSGKREATAVPVSTGDEAICQHVAEAITAAIASSKSNGIFAHILCNK